MDALLEKITTLYRLFVQWCELHPDAGNEAPELILYATGSGGVIDGNGNWVASWDAPDNGIEQITRRIEEPVEGKEVRQ